jgi:hypothetical protein
MVQDYQEMYEQLLEQDRRQKAASTLTETIVPV